NHGTLSLEVGGAEAFLDDIGTEFLLGQCWYTAREAETQRLCELGFIEVKDVLNDVIAERILNEGESIFGDAGDELSALVSGRMVNAALQHATAMAMCPDNDAVLANRIVDEFAVLSAEPIQAFL